MQVIKFLKTGTLLFLCACFYTGLWAQQGKTESNLLYWTKDRRLTFEDFRLAPAVPDTIFVGRGRSMNTHRLGMILTAIEVQVKTEESGAVFTVRAVMDKAGSWIRNNGDSISLKHEQAHFDLAEIYARIMRRELRKATTMARSKVIYEEVLAAESADHTRFDQENTFEKGGVTKEWASKIAGRLAQLESFANPAVKLSFNKKPSIN